MSRKTVLLVEDNPDSRLIYATVLQRMGYEIVAAATGGEALAWLETNTPDLILLDIALPGVDGWTIADMVRSSEATMDTPIIGVSASYNSTDLHRAMHYELIDYMCKPVDPFVVASCVEAAIGRSERRSEADRRAGRERRHRILGQIAEEHREGADRRTDSDRRGLPIGPGSIDQL